MLDFAQRNVNRAGLERQIQLALVDGKRLPYAASRFAAVISNSIVHHIPEPAAVLEGLVRVVVPGGVIFVRDLLRPIDNETVQQLVATYAADANSHQRQMFDDSLRAALSLEEIRALVHALGFPPETVRPTSDRHWTWAVRAPEK
jgi:ubiquinone/menaquinone biosynthesis C-methylase UbiE